MKGELIFVFYIPDAAQGNEGKNGAYALYSRLVTEKKAQSIYLVEVPGNAKNFNRFRFREATHHLVPTHQEVGTGAYIIAHHGMSITGFSSLPADEMATMLAGFLDDAEVPPLTKVALLACKGGLGVSAKVAKKPLPDNKRVAFDNTLMVQFCTHLASKGHCPKIAGWDCYITVCYGGNPNVNHPPAENSGRKTHSSNGDRITDKYRDDHKKVLQWIGTDAQRPISVTKWAGWTQRDQ